MAITCGLGGDHQPSVTALIPRVIAGGVRSLELRPRLIALTLPTPIAEPGWLADCGCRPS